jgi:hypothetical protein
MPELAIPPAAPDAAPGGCLGCSRLEVPDAPTVTLLTGAVVCTWCPAYRLECHDRQVEAHAVLRMPDRPTRLAHLARREAEFGSEYRRRLEAVILQTWEARRASSTGA